MDSRAHAFKDALGFFHHSCMDSFTDAYRILGHI